MGETYNLDDELKKVTDAIEEALKVALPADMDRKKVIDRMFRISAFIGNTRTAAAAAVIHAAYTARIVGLDIAKIHELISVIDKVMEASPIIEDCKARYAAINAEFHKKQQFADEFDTPLLPGDNKIH